VYKPAELGALMAYLAIKRGPCSYVCTANSARSNNCSVLIHPNTSDEVADHTTLATWMGTPIALDVDLLRALEAKTG
jgi:aromatic ring-cleaving dioxygenase